MTPELFLMGLVAGLAAITLLAALALAIITVVNWKKIVKAELSRR